MDTEEWVKQQEIRKALQQWLLQWRPQWFCTMNLPPKKNYNDAEGYLKEWRRPFHKAGIEIGYNGLYLSVPHPHIHLLAMGCDKDEPSLIYVDREKWEQEWARLTKQTAVIRWINDPEAVTEYVAFKNTVPGKYELLSPHNEKMLGRYKRK